MTAPRGRAVGSGPFLDLAVFPEAIESCLATGRAAAITPYLDRFLELQTDAELDALLSRSPAPQVMHKGGRNIPAGPPQKPERNRRGRW